MAAVTAVPSTRDGAEAVKVAVVLPDGGGAGVSADGHVVNYASRGNEGAESFSYDLAVTADTMTNLHPELLLPLAESMSSGRNGAVLICGASTESIRSLADERIIQQLLQNLFRRLSSLVKDDLFASVSFLQFFPDGTAADLLGPSGRNLKLVPHPVLGSLVAGLCESCVSSHEEAFSVYQTCSEAMKGNVDWSSGRCSCLFSVAFEWRLHPEAEELLRSRLQLFSLAGGASRSHLRGVSFLVKVVEQITCGGSANGQILHLLLQDALTGNSQTVLIYFINAQDLPGDETSAALALAQTVRGLVTKATNSRWHPRAAEQEIRDSIRQLRSLMLSEEENNAHNGCRLAELMLNLQMVKNQSWEKRREAAKKIKSMKGPDQLSGDHSPGCTDTVKSLQEQLRWEMEEHLREGEGSAEKLQERVSRIHRLKEALRAEMLRSGSDPGSADGPHPQLEALQRRRQLKEEHGRLIQEEVEKMERDLAQEEPPSEGLQRELLVLSRERRVLVLQVEALRAEAQQAETDLQHQHHRHQAELQSLREESLQVFRVFRQVNEEQRKMSESRYRNVLLEAVQDAVYLSAQNQQLQLDNTQLRRALAEMKDTLAVRSEPQQK